MKRICTGVLVVLVVLGVLLGPAVVGVFGAPRSWDAGGDKVD